MRKDKSFSMKKKMDEGFVACCYSCCVDIVDSDKNLTRERTSKKNLLINFSMKVLQRVPLLA